MPYTIKSTPEDFTVEELALYKPELEGSYLYCLLQKRNQTIAHAIGTLALFLGIKERKIGYAGNKDRAALTTQFITIGATPQLQKKVHQFKHPDIVCTPLGFLSHPLSLGDLVGNKFTIVVRDIEKKAIQKLLTFPPQFSLKNYFGDQRFSTHNVEIGTAILKKNFKEAVEIIGKIDKAIFPKKSSENDYLGILKSIPLRTLKLYVHSYQSHLFNIVLKSIPNPPPTLPLPGFATQFTDKTMETLYGEIMERDGITLGHFLIRSFPELSSEGIERESLMQVKEFSILNHTSSSVTLSFVLPKGSYATEVVAQLLTDS